MTAAAVAASSSSVRVCSDRGGGSAEGAACDDGSAGDATSPPDCRELPTSNDGATALLCPSPENEHLNGRPGSERTRSMTWL